MKQHVYYVRSPKGWGSPVYGLEFHTLAEPGSSLAITGQRWRKKTCSMLVGSIGSWNFMVRLWTFDLPKNISSVGHIATHLIQAF